MSFFSKTGLLNKKVTFINIRQKINFKINLPRIILAFFIVFSIFTGFLLLSVKRSGWVSWSVPDLRVGDISPKNEIALFDFDVPKPKEKLDFELKEAADKITPYFIYKPDALSQTYMIIDSLFIESAGFIGGNGSVSGEVPDMPVGIAGDRLRKVSSISALLKKNNPGFAGMIKRNIVEAAKEVYENYNISQRDLYINITKEKFMLQYPDSLKEIRFNNTISITDAKEIFKSKIARLLDKSILETDLESVQNIFSEFIYPNAIYDFEKTEKLKKHAMEDVSPIIVSYKKNERFIEANVPVTELNILALNTYKNEIDRRSMKYKWVNYFGRTLGGTFAVICIIAVYLYYLSIYRRKLFESFQSLLLLTILIFMPLFISFYTDYTRYLSPYLIPVALSSILAAILIDAETGLWITLVVSFSVSAVFGDNGLRTAFIYFIGGSSGVLSLRHVRKRKEFYRSMFIVPLSMILSFLATWDWVNSGSFSGMSSEILSIAINGLFCPIIAIGVLPILESIFKTVTDITLLELSDLNNPLLKELAVKAPGSFSASLMVGTLAEAAAETVGANSLLARVGSYYHDIGKMTIPEYYIENQMGVDNPHNKLNPYMSALVIASHVKEGVELGRKSGLPKPILDIILQHHGTSVMASIYQKALENADNKNVDEHHFRYPGPKPQTKEAGIVMLADLVEAAGRSVHEQSPKRIRLLIHTIIRKRFTEGELDECELTLKDIHAIEESFLPVLLGSHHTRIIYPWQQNDKRFQKHYKNNSAGANV